MLFLNFFGFFFFQIRKSLKGERLQRKNRKKKKKKSQFAQLKKKEKKRRKEKKGRKRKNTSSAIRNQCAHNLQTCTKNNKKTRKTWKQQVLFHLKHSEKRKKKFTVPIGKLCRFSLTLCFRQIIDNIWSKIVFRILHSKLSQALFCTEKQTSRILIYFYFLL